MYSKYNKKNFFNKINFSNDEHSKKIQFILIIWYDI